MGYEIVYHYKREVAPGQYSEETETKSVKVGQPTDDLGLEVAAGKIIAQLARRNILVVDVECYEFTKKKLNVKLADDGVVIKNKKFTFDDGAAVPTACDTDIGATAEQLIALLQSNPQLLQAVQQPQPQGLQPHQQPAIMAAMLKNLQQQQPGAAVPGAQMAAAAPTGILRWEVFEPELPNLMEAKKNGLRFTLGKKYPIYSERMIGIPPITNTLYTLQDDGGQKVEVSAKYFAPARPHKLAYEDEMKGGADVGGDEPKLAWGDAVDDDMPDVRR